MSLPCRSPNKAALARFGVPVTEMRPTLSLVGSAVSVHMRSWVVSRMKEEIDEAHYSSGADYLFRGRYWQRRSPLRYSKAVSADGKPLHGAAKMSFVKKCKRDACGSKAVSADGKPLHSAAKNSFMAKCMRST